MGGYEWLSMKFATDRLVLRWLCAELSMISMSGSSESHSMKMNKDPYTRSVLFAGGTWSFNVFLLFGWEVWRYDW